MDQGAEFMYDTVIIGGGIAGLTAAVYARRAGLSTVVCEATVCGGQIINSPEVDNYPARPHVAGWQLAADLQAQAEEFGAEIKFCAVTGLSVKSGKKTVHTSAGDLDAKTVIIANGAEHRRLDCDGADRLYQKGVSACATCDGAFFRGRECCVVGGGNTAFEDAVYLSSLASKVYLINRRSVFRAEPKLVSALKSKENVEILTPWVPERILGEQRVEGFEIKNVDTGEKRTLPVSGVFAAIGMIPANGIFSGTVELDESGYIKADESCRTSVPGVFAAGDTRVKALRQLVTAAADGAVAASQAAAYINLAL